MRERSFWRVRWRESGRVRRKFFTGRDAADAFAARLRGERVVMRQTLALLSPVEQEQLMLIYADAQRREMSLGSVLTLMASAPVARSDAPALADVLSEMITAKRNAGREESYLRSLKQIVDQFARGRERMPIDKLSVREVESFMEAKNIAYWCTLRARLSTLFKFSIRRGYRSDNPCAQLEPASAPHVPPEILTVAETVKCLDWFKTRPRALAWFILSAFAGLRPEEAQGSSWKDINFDEGWIKIERQTTKTRQRRVVYPMPMAMEWLRMAKGLKAELPLTTKQRTVELRELRTVLGWSTWKQDVTRHSAASYWLAESGSASLVATAIGNSESVLLKDYKALVTKVQAAEFWALSPQQNGAAPSRDRPAQPQPNEAAA